MPFCTHTMSTRAIYCNQKNHLVKWLMKTIWLFVGCVRFFFYFQHPGIYYRKKYLHIICHSSRGERVSVLPMATGNRFGIRFRMHHASVLRRTTHTHIFIDFDDVGNKKTFIKIFDESRLSHFISNIFFSLYLFAGWGCISVWWHRSGRSNKCVCTRPLYPFGIIKWYEWSVASHCSLPTSIAEELICLRCMVAGCWAKKAENLWRFSRRDKRYSFS